jgi:hypothetical protein
MGPVRFADRNRIAAGVWHERPHVRQDVDPRFRAGSGPSLGTLLHLWHKEIRVSAELIRGCQNRSIPDHYR